MNDEWVRDGAKRDDANAGIWKRWGLNLGRSTNGVFGNSLAYVSDGGQKYLKSKYISMQSFTIYQTSRMNDAT